MYGRNFEETSSIERYQVLGHMIRDYVGINWRETKKCDQKERDKAVILFLHGIFRWDVFSQTT